MITLEDLCDPAPEDGNDWNPDGYEVIPRLFTDELIDAYRQEWLAEHGDSESKAGWVDYWTPYTDHPALARLVCDGGLATHLENLAGEPLAVHLNLTAWVSSERDWHQDTYLSPPEVGDRYAAVWIALDDIHPDSGPFQMIAGSHRWFRIMRDRVLAAMPPDTADDPAWPRYTEALLTELIEQEIEEHEAPIIDFLPSKGEALIWHPRLLHRGSRATVSGMLRPALIAHFSALDRADMPGPAVQHEAGGWMFEWP